MNNLTPFHALNELHRELSRVFDEPARESSSYLAAGWAPQVDINESDSAFTVTADVPGVNPENVEVTLHNGVLTIKGERTDDKTEETGAFRRRERVRGSFFRQFSLPQQTDENGIKANANNGVLEITIPKAERPKPLSIQVQGA